MATRALINIVDRQEGRSFSKTLPSTAIHTQIYKHYDGYPEALGVTLANYLSGYDIRNGIPNNHQGLIANGIGCLAAQLVSYIKNEPGDIYLRKPSNIDLEDYVYYIWVKENEEVIISIFDCEDEQCLFVGNTKKLLNEYKHD